MQKYFEKIKERLEEELESTREIQTIECKGNNGYGTPLQAKLSGEICTLLKAIEIVNQVAEEYGGDINVGSNDCENCLSTEYIQDKLREMYEDGYVKALDDAIEKFLEYGCVCVEWNSGLPKEKLVDDVLRQAMGQVVYILEKMKGVE